MESVPALLQSLKKGKITEVQLSTEEDPSKGAVSLQCGITIRLGRLFSPVQLLGANYSYDGLLKSHSSAALTADVI